MKEITSPLSNEFKVACEIYHNELRNSPIEFKQLVKEMNGIVTEDEIKKELDILFDWGIVNVEFTDSHRKVIVISTSSRPVIASLYDKYWRKYKLLTMENPLSNTFKVACEVYSYNKKGEDIWADKLINGMEGILSKGPIHKALGILYDWQIVTCNGHVRDNGKSVKLLTISPRAKYMVEQNYDHCWEEYRQLILEYGIPETPDEVILGDDTSEIKTQD